MRIPGWQAAAGQVRPAAGGVVLDGHHRPLPRPRDALDHGPLLGTAVGPLWGTGGWSGGGGRLPADDWRMLSSGGYFLQQQKKTAHGTDVAYKRCSLRTPIDTHHTHLPD